MASPMIYDLVTGVVGGLCIFLLGMKHMSEGMQAVAGSKLRRMVATLTDRRALACATGAGVTALIQSSSVTAVMAVGMVNAGVMTLTQAAGVILGADIGTTITAWIVSLNVLKYGLPFLGVTGFVYLFSKNERVRYTFMTLMGVGMVFFGLQLMKHGLEPLQDSPAVLAWFARYEPTSYLGVIKCVLIGAAVTAIVQSSSATVAITITLARSEIIGFDAAVALVLGQNIGTTITAYLACLGASTNAKRAAYAHIGMKLIAVILMVPCFFLYMRFLSHVLKPDMDIAKQIAFAHTLFNVLLVCLFLPLLTPFITFLKWIVPDRPHKEVPHLTFLDVRLLDTPAFGIQQSLDEINQMGGGVSKMLGWLRQSICDEDGSEDREKKLFHRETVLDIMQKEISEFLGSVLSGSVPHDVVEEARKQLRIADEYESVSDYVVSILKLHLRGGKLDLALSQTDRDDILRLHDRVSGYVEMISEAVSVGNAGILSKACTEGEIITRMMKDLRYAHIEKLEKKDASALKCLLIVDMLQAYRKIKDHALNIAEALAGEK
jgi:phosphate:Na+ symporter